MKRSKRQTTVAAATPAVPAKPAEMSAAARKLLDNAALRAQSGPNVTKTRQQMARKKKKGS